MDCPLKIYDRCGIIFSTSTKAISGTLNIESTKRLHGYELLILDKNSDKVIQKPLKSDGSKTTFEIAFCWDLKSESGSYVRTGCYTIKLVNAEGESREIEGCAIECKVIDTRDILPITESLKLVQKSAPDSPLSLYSVYFDMIKDIQREILNRLENNRFEDPFFVACITTCFIQDIAVDIHSGSRSRFRELIAGYQSRHPLTERQLGDGRLGLWTLFDFLINYMADTEDKVRANALAKCGQHQLTPHDKDQIVSSLVTAIYPYCKIMTFPDNAIGRIVETISERAIKLGISYVSAKHVNSSIRISRTLKLGDPCDAIR